MQAVALQSRICFCRGQVSAKSALWKYCLWGWLGAALVIYSWPPDMLVLEPLGRTSGSGQGQPLLVPFPRATWYEL